MSSDSGNGWTLFEMLLYGILIILFIVIVVMMITGNFGF